MKSKSILATALLASAPAMAFTMPDVCKTAANYTVQAMDQHYDDGDVGNPNNPNQITLGLDFKFYPVISVKDLGSCDEKKFKDSWCSVAGGSPEVFQIDVAYDSNGKGSTAYPFATVYVTYNRGGCWVDEAARK